jgi:hypothetical protein
MHYTGLKTGVNFNQMGKALQAGKQIHWVISHVVLLQVFSPYKS